jgi:hypothetical protein
MASPLAKLLLGGLGVGGLGLALNAMRGGEGQALGAGDNAPPLGGQPSKPVDPFGGWDRASQQPQQPAEDFPEYRPPLPQQQPPPMPVFGAQPGGQPQPPGMRPMPLPPLRPRPFMPLPPIQGVR